jgi:hypothetical protein
MDLEKAVIIGGVVHLGILSAGLVMTKVLNWREDLKKLDQLSQHVIWTHAGYVWLVILAFGLVSVLCPRELVNQDPLGIAICGFISLFWGIRLIIQFFYFDAKPHLTNSKLKLGFHCLTCCFAYFTIVYGWVVVDGVSK